VSILSPILRFNYWTNRLFHRFSHEKTQVETYREQLDLCLSGAKDAVHLGAGGKDPATLCSADLSGIRIYAVDPSSESLSRNPNPNKIEAWGHDIPLDDRSVDVVFSEYLMEHVANPEATLREAFRLLRPGGRLLWMAPNLWSYGGLITHYTPVWFHKLVTRLLEPVSQRRASVDVFCTYFRINSIGKIQRILRDTGFEIEELISVSDAPHYTMILPVIHQLAVLLHILLARVNLLRYFRSVQVVRARKPLA
jgi:ubiquinone/menaquinone biosynthesis C-methylase UbiE